MLGPGSRVDRYELVSLLGEGGMAQVWAARQEGKHGFKKLFALKAVHQRLADDPEFHKMFLDEARIASEVEHPNVAQVFDLGEQGSTLYLVMEYVDGESLAALLGGIARSTGGLARVPVAEALRIVSDVCSGLNAAHKLVGSDGHLRGVVHRDVSPQNVLLSVKGDVKLIDFGIAIASNRGAGNTGVGEIKGKLRYMAPEQARRERVGPFTDVWAAGAMLYRLLAGRSPFEASTEVETLELLLSGAAPTPLPESVPPLVTAIVERALESDPGDRYASAAEMRAALDGAIAEDGRVPNVSGWVSTNLTDRYRSRKQALAAREAMPHSGTPIDKTMPSALRPDLAPSPPSVPSLDVPDKPPPERPPPSVEEPEVHITLQSEVRPFGDGPPIPRSVTEPLLEKPPTPIEVKITRSTEIGPKDESPAEDEEPRSFMDVRAIVAERVAERDAEAADAADAKKQKGKAKAKAKGDGVLPQPRHAPRSAKSAADIEVEEEEDREARRKKRLVAGVAFGAVACVVVGVLLALPAIVRGRIVSAAREVGVELTLDSLSVGVSGVTVHGITAVAASLPGVKVTIDHVRTTGLSSTEVYVTGVSVDAQGGASELGSALLRFYDAHRAQLSPPHGTPSRHVAVAAGRLHWSDPFGAGTKIDAGDVSVDVDSRAVGTEEIRALAGRFEVKTQKTLFGPWSGTFERTRQSMRARVAFDPPLPDGPHAVYMWGPGTEPHLTVHVPRVAFAQLGIRPQEIGIPAEPGSEVAIELDGGLRPNQRVEGQGRIELFGARIQGWKQPVDGGLAGAAGGAPGKPLELSRATATLGPFTAFLTGTVTPHDRGLRLDAAYKTQPILCERLARAEAKSLGAFAATVQELAQATGAVRMTGSAYAAGRVMLDSAAPEAASVTFQTRESCGLSLFGQP